MPYTVLVSADKSTLSVANDDKNIVLHLHNGKPAGVEILPNDAVKALTAQGFALDDTRFLTDIERAMFDKMLEDAQDALEMVPFLGPNLEQDDSM